MAAGRLFTRGEHLHRVVIGKDTRLSGYMIESALVAGFTAVCMEVFQFGPLPTPSVVPEKKEPPPAKPMKGSALESANWGTP